MSNDYQNAPCITYVALHKSEFYNESYSHCKSLADDPLYFSDIPIYPHNYYHEYYDEIGPFYGFFIHLATHNKAEFEKAILMNGKKRPCTEIKNLDRKCNFECSYPAEIIKIGTEERFKCIHRAMYTPTARFIISRKDIDQRIEFWEYEERNVRYVEFYFANGKFRYFLKLRSNKSRRVFYIMQAFPVYRHCDMEYIRKRKNKRIESEKT